MEHRPKTLNEIADAKIRACVARYSEPATDSQLLGTLRWAAKWRSHAIAEALIQDGGAVVRSGPFAGLRYVRRTGDGSLCARLIGSYESELHPHIEAFAAEGLDVVINIGCAEGFYAVGMARLMPGVEVCAYDVSAAAQEDCAETAEANAVSDQVRIGGQFTGEDFAAFNGRKALVLIDAEGAEDDLLDPAAFPALAEMNVIVETHPGARNGVTERLTERFTPSHDVLRVEQQAKDPPLPDWLAANGHLDQLLAVWEWRGSPTPWLVMRPRVQPA